MGLSQAEVLLSMQVQTFAINRFQKRSWAPKAVGRFTTITSSLTHQLRSSQSLWHLARETVRICLAAVWRSIRFPTQWIVVYMDATLVLDNSTTTSHKTECKLHSPAITSQETSVGQVQMPDRPVTSLTLSRTLYKRPLLGAKRFTRRAACAKMKALSLYKWSLSNL